MRLWTLHPMYLDTPGLNGLWKEACLAKKCLEGKTKGYANHSQLERFKAAVNQEYLIHEYLFIVYKESEKRGFNYNKNNFRSDFPYNIPETIETASAQLEFEFNHLKKKLENRQSEGRIKLPKTYLECFLNPVFTMFIGPLPEWEKIN